MSKVYIEVFEGNVIGAYSDTRNVELIVCDYDNAKAGDEIHTKNCEYVDKHRNDLYDLF